MVSGKTPRSGGWKVRTQEEGWGAEFHPGQSTPILRFSPAIVNDIFMEDFLEEATFEEGSDRKSRKKRQPGAQDARASPASWTLGEHLLCQESPSGALGGLMWGVLVLCLAVAFVAF